MNSTIATGCEDRGKFSFSEGKSFVDIKVVWHRINVAESRAGTRVCIELRADLAADPSVHNEGEVLWDRATAVIQFDAGVAVSLPEILRCGGITEYERAIDWLRRARLSSSLRLAPAILLRDRTGAQIFAKILFGTILVVQGSRERVESRRWCHFVWRVVSSLQQREKHVRVWEEGREEEGWRAPGRIYIVVIAGKV